MKILGWAPGSRMILVQTERSALGTDAGPTEAVMAMDAKTGEVYQPDLSAVLQGRKPTGNEGANIPLNSAVI
jgi:hypothetical protein